MASWQQTLEMIHAIPETTCGGQQPQLLYELSCSARGDGEVVEIGTYVGKSTIALAHGQKDTGGSAITTIDPAEHPDVEQYLAEAEVTQYVNRIVARSSEVGRRWSKPIKLLWIDGDHSYVGAATDISIWSGFVRPGGVIALHDYPGHRGSMEVWKAVYRHLLSRPYEWRVLSDRRAGSIFAMERVLDGSTPPPDLALSSRVYWWKRNLKTRIEELRARMPV